MSQLSESLLHIATDLAASLAKNRAALTALAISTNKCITETSSATISPINQQETETINRQVSSRESKDQKCKEEYEELLQLHHATLQTMQKLMNHIHAIKVEHNNEMISKNEQVLIWKTQVIQQFELLQNENLVLTEKLGKARETMNSLARHEESLFMQNTF